MHTKGYGTLICKCVFHHQPLHFRDISIVGFLSVCPFVCVLATIFFCHHMQQDNKIYSNAIGSLLHWLYDVKTKLTSPQWWSI